ncbi:hypothetical protein GGI21_003142 [Coemansia aciculifera]|nr:hypothetical protein GGI21_003142 [Coemansia aciculifera]
MGDEVINATQPSAPSLLPSSSRQLPVSVATADAGAEEDIDEVERWKDHWADEDEDGSSDHGGYNALDAGITPMNPVRGSTLSSLADDVQPSSVPDAVAVPDTSGDEEFARKLQEEFESHT